MASLNMHPNLPVPKGPLRPSNSTICPRTAPKRPPKAPEFVHVGRPQPQTKVKPYLGLRGSKHVFQCTKSTCNHPLLVVCIPLKIAKTDTYPYPGPVGYGKPQEVAKQVGAKLAEHGPPGAVKDLFSKMILDHMECQNRCFWRVLSPLWPVFPLLQSQNALEMGCFGTINGSKMGLKWVGHEWVKNACFPKTDPRPFGVCK